MNLISFGYINLKDFIKNLLYFYMFSFFLGGTLYYLKIESLSGTNKFDREIGTVSLKASFEYGEIPAGSEIIFTWKLLDQEDKYLTTFTNDGYNTAISSINYIYKDQKLNGATQNLNFSSSMIRDDCCKVAVGVIIKYVENDIIEESDDE